MFYMYYSSVLKVVKKHPNSYKPKGQSVVKKLIEKLECKTPFPEKVILVNTLILFLSQH